MQSPVRQKLSISPTPFCVPTAAPAAAEKNAAAVMPSIPFTPSVSFSLKSPTILPKSSSPSRFPSFIRAIASDTDAPPAAPPVSTCISRHISSQPDMSYSTAGMDISSAIAIHGDISSATSSNSPTSLQDRISPPRLKIP